MSADERHLDELLGAYALDAVTDDERRAVENYLRVNPRARAEVQEHREVATMLAWSSMDAPDGLWERIADSLDDQAPVPRGELAEVLSFEAGRERRRSWQRSIGSWVAATAAAAVVAVLAVTVIDRGGDGSGGLAAAAEAARADRDSVVASLASPDGTTSVEVIIDQDGHGYLLAGSLPSLPDDRTYQLWGVINDQAISLGVLGRSPELETFSVEGELTALVITNEVAGGVISDGNMDGAWIGAIA